MTKCLHSIFSLRSCITNSILQISCKLISVILDGVYLCFVVIEYEIAEYEFLVPRLHDNRFIQDDVQITFHCDDLRINKCMIWIVI